MRIMPGYCVGVKGASPAASRSGKPRGEFGGELVRLVSIDTRVPRKCLLTKQEPAVFRDNCVDPRVAAVGEFVGAGV